MMTLGCSCGPRPDEHSYVGTWRYSSTECNGSPVVLGGLVQQYTIERDVASSVTSTGLGAGRCTSMLSGVPVTDDSGAIRIHEGAADTVECEPTLCEHEIGGETVRCPQDLPAAGVVYEVVEVGEDEMVTTFGECEQTWLRQ